MGVDDLRLSLSLHRLLALRIPSVGDHRYESYDVTFFFVGAVFGIATSAAVACNPSVPCGQEQRVSRDARIQRTTREVSE